MIEKFIKDTLLFLLFFAILFATFKDMKRILLLINFLWLPLGAEPVWPYLRERLLEQSLPTELRQKLPDQEACDEDAAEWLRSVAPVIMPYVAQHILYCVEHNSLAVVSALLPTARVQKNTQVNVTECARVAARSGHIALLRFCLRNGASIGDIVLTGVVCANEAVVQACLDQSQVDVREMRGSIEETPVLLAARLGHTGIVRMLLDAECKHVTVEAPGNWYGWNVREIAGYYNHYDLARTLKQEYDFPCRRSAKVIGGTRDWMQRMHWWSDQAAALGPPGSSTEMQTFAIKKTLLPEDNLFFLDCEPVQLTADVVHGEHMLQELCRRAEQLHFDFEQVREDHPVLARRLAHVAVPGRRPDQGPDEYAVQLHETAGHMLQALMNAVAPTSPVQFTTDDMQVLADTAALMPRFACQANAKELVRLFLNRLPRIAPDDKQLGSHNALLVCAAARGHAQLVEYILAQGCSLPGMAARAAARYRHETVLRRCIERDPRCVGRALMLKKGQFEVVDGIFPHQTVLGNAIGSGDPKFVAYVLSLPSARESINSMHGVLQPDGNTTCVLPLHLARSIGNQPIVQLLLTAGAQAE